MIQRIQTIWLLLAAITAFLVTQVPLYQGSLVGVTAKRFFATENLLMFAITVIAALLGLFAIFLFKNRKTQLKLTRFGILASIILIALEVWLIQGFNEDNPTLKGSYYWGALLPIAMTIFFILAAINIGKDEKLVKSLNRFR